MKKLFSFSDTAGRLEYFFIFLVLYALFTYFLIFTTDDLNPFRDYGVLGVFLIIPIILANICRRLNDLGKSRYFTLVAFIPIVNLIFFLYLLFAPGKKN